MVEREDCRYPGPEVISDSAVAGISKLGHELVPEFRNVAIVDANLSWAWRESISRQGGYDQVEIIEHRQHIQIIQETAGPAVCKNKRFAPARCRRLIHAMDAFPC